MSSIEGVEKVTYERDWLGRHLIVLKGKDTEWEIIYFDIFSRTYDQHTHLEERRRIEEKFIGAEKVEARDAVDERFERKTTKLAFILLALMCIVPLIGSIFILPILYDLDRERKRARIRVNGKYLGSFKTIVVYKRGERTEYHPFPELLQ